MKRLITIAVGATLILPGALTGQEEVRSAELPDEVAREIVRFFNAPETIRMDGGGRVPSGRRVDGDVAVLGGSLELAGRIDGDLVVANGDLALGPDAVVAGDVTVAGGRVSGAEDASIAGSVSVYRDRFRYIREGERIALAPRRGREDLSSTLGLGRLRFTVRAGTNYNRVEGLPVMFGPIVETASANPLRLETLAVWRTDEGFDLDTDEMGYRVRLEQYLGGRQLYSVGATAHSLVEPLERWTLTDLESSLAAFLLHRDYRDYVETTGWSAFLRASARRLPLDVRAEYREEEHAFAPAATPWSLKDNDVRWRPQPLVAEGRIRSVAAEVTVDTRNDAEEPTHGWWIRARARRGVGGAVEIPGYSAPWTPPGVEAATQATAGPRSVDPGFTTGFLDIRRYNRVSPSSELVLRGVFGGSLDGEPLPPQYQHAMGGEGSLPGFPLFSLDCGARGRVVAVEGRLDHLGFPEPAVPGYGCDRMALFQAEYRGGFGWEVDLGDDDEDGWDEGWSWDGDLRFRPRWAAFLDAGRGWSLTESDDDGQRFDENSHLDVGLGLFVGNLGFYLAAPLSGDGSGVNFFVRLDHRF